ncbi:hypothetical protein [Salinivibrio sp. ML290]|uniref:hypothetical protein n=1 Tax=Salinivibrio sp. ML290 TaxID=1909468 RepID=UPI00098891D2|nr:hypothetical protein [Salinivibrio sp. ML290]OOE74022.1 hypothetical protein BZG23_09650 [Salinivibrio sp. ML290]
MEDGYSLKHLFENCFGRKAWHELKHCTDLAIWKKYCTRLLSAIEVSAKATVEIADEVWFEELSGEVGHGKDMVQLSQDFEQLFSNLAASLGAISFLQLGLVPRRLTVDSVTLRHPSNWKLDRYRSVQYVQNSEQRENSYNKKKKSEA